MHECNYSANVERVSLEATTCDSHECIDILAIHLYVTAFSVLIQDQAA